MSMTPQQAVSFVEQHGIVLESARHATIPSLADTVAEEPVSGRWWSHPRGRAIFAATRAVRDEPQILVCRLVDNHITFVHARLWPALVRVEHAFEHAALTRLREVHTPRGAHRIEEIAFPQWVDAATLAAARDLGEASARTALANVLDTIAGAA
jgi:hypothetical protein